MEETIGPYQIEDEIGRGGMGVVYRARDSRLDRVVAIKSLPEEFAEDPVRLDRFEREARVLAQVTHANIAGIYGLEEKNGARYLVLEFVEGETLAEVLERGPLPIDDAVEIAAQIADGVAAAHDAGVVHRDLKPGNVIITPDGRAKVLDFGLARADGVVDASTGEMTQTPTATYGNSPTIPGAILGTAPYMSPEQARGKMVDKRTDIWSFGAMLYEMLTGIGPFHGETATESIGAILHKDVDLDALPAGTPPHIRRVLERCLERDKNARFRDIGDVRIELLRGGEWRELSSPAETLGKSVSGILIAAGAVLSAACVGGVWWLTTAMQPAEVKPVRKLDIVTAGMAERLSDSSPRIAPAGDRVAFIRENAIHVRVLSEFESRPIPGSDGAERFCWSPDGRWLAFASTDGIFKIPSAGGGATKITDLDVQFAFTWTTDDRIVVSNSASNDDQVFEIPVRGGSPKTLFDGDDRTIDFHAIASIPGTDVLLYVRHALDGSTPIEAWNGTQTVTVVDVDDTYLASFAWSPTGHVLFSRGMGTNDVWAVPFSPDRMAVTGDPFLVMADAGSPSVSADGTLAVLRGTRSFGGELVWISPNGEIEAIGDTGEVVIDPLVSPDGSRIAFGRGRTPQEMDLWVRDLERGVNTRIADTNSFVATVAWSPDGEEIAVMTFDPTAGDQAQRTQFFATDGTGATRTPYKGLLPAISSDWTRAVSSTDVMEPTVTYSAIRLDDYSVIGEILTASKTWLYAGLDPTDSLLAYQSGESGEVQIYCTTFPSGEGRWQVSSDGGNSPFWAPDGSAIYYQADDALFRVRVTREPDLRFGVPERLFDLNGLDRNFQGRLSTAPDGERFTGVRSNSEEDGETNPQSISVVQNWFEEFREEPE